MLFGITSIDRQTLINNVVGFSKATKVFGLPTVLSTVETKAFSGYIWPQLKAQFPDITPIERSSMNSWDDAMFVAAIKASGRKKIVLAGIAVQNKPIVVRLEGYDCRLIPVTLRWAPGQGH